MSEDIDLMTLYHQRADTLYKATLNELEALKLDKKNLLKLAAQAVVRGDLLEEQYHFLLAERTNSGLGKIEDVQQKEIITQQIFEVLQADTTKAVSEVNRMAAQKRSNNCRNAANKKHEKSGVKGKHKALRLTWGTGIYATKDECAEEECLKHGMTYEAARKALYNEPEPS